MLNSTTAKTKAGNGPLGYVLSLLAAFGGMQLPFGGDGGLRTVQAAPSDYEFRQIASTPSDLALLLSQFPEVNDSGQVLFIARLPNKEEAILLGDGSSLTTVTAWGIPGEMAIRGNLQGKQQLNDLSEVVFRGGHGGSDESIYHWTVESGLTPLYSTTGPSSRTFNFESEPSINNAGDLAFVANGQGLPEAVFLGDRNGTFPTTALAATGGPLFEGFSQFFQPEISGDGVVVVRAMKNDSEGIHKLTGPGTSVPIMEVGNGFDLLNGDFDINDQGQVAFWAEQAGGLGGIFVGDEDHVEAIASDRPDLELIGPPGLNDLGDVVFRARDTSASAPVGLLLTGPDPVLDRVIGQGDDLLGMPVTDLVAGRGSINNSGQIAFFAARFNPGTSLIERGIFLAMPIPEPSGLSLFGLTSSGLMGFGLCRRRKLRSVRQ